MKQFSVHLRLLIFLFVIICVTSCEINDNNINPKQTDSKYYRSEINGSLDPWLMRMRSSIQNKQTIQNVNSEDLLSQVDWSKAIRIEEQDKNRIAYTLPLYTSSKGSLQNMIVYSKDDMQVRMLSSMITIHHGWGQEI